jgi:hypothetical protein
VTVFLKSLFKIALILGLAFSYLRASAQVDTIRLQRDQIIVFKDSIFIPANDTLILISKDKKFKVRENPYSKSDRFYDSIYSKSYKNKITKDLYKLIFRPPIKDVYMTDKAVESEDYYSGFEGKRIRDIRIVKVPILDGNVRDTTSVIESGVGKFVNSVHSKTRNSFIRKNLLFEEGDKVVDYLLSDSERILRSQDNLVDARILVVDNSENDDWVDIVVVTKDKFPYLLIYNYRGPTRFDLGVGDRNFLGYGTRLSLTYLFNLDDPVTHGYDISTINRNVFLPFTNLRFQIADNWRYKRKLVSLSRPFVSPEIKYGGEIIYDDREQNETFVVLDSSYENRMRTRSIDFWFSRAFQLGGQNSRYTFAPGIRYLKSNSIKRPDSTSENLYERYYDRDLVIGSISFQKINFVKTRYVYTFGITEDVPTGFRIAFDFGKDFTEFGDRNYYNGTVTGSEYFNFGYVYSSFSYGKFIYPDRTNTTLAKINLGYFTNLQSIGRFRTRTFLNLDYAVGEDLTLPEVFLLSNFISTYQRSLFTGNELFSVDLESVLFSPWYFYGFKFAPYIYTEYGMINENRIETVRSRDVWSLGGGFRLRNESLASSSLQLSFKYYPVTVEGASTYKIKLKFNNPRLFRSLLDNKPRIVSIDGYNRYQRRQN